MSLYDGLIGQEQARRALTAAAEKPVHAYLLVGPPGTGKRTAATDFAAALLCPGSAPDGTCETCRRVRAGLHPDVIHVEREGAAIGIDSARAVTQLAAMSPVEGGRKVIVLHDFHLVKDTGPALLKTIEEPPPSTVFVILAEQVPPDLVTIASRCVQVDFTALTPAQIEGALLADGVPPDRATALARACGGRLDRARLLAGDPQFEARHQAWRQVASRLDGTGATAAAVADELIGFLETSVEPLKVLHAGEMESLVERNRRANEVTGSRSAKRPATNTGVKELEERHRRAERRQRTDELRAGLATLSAAYGERLGDHRRRAPAMQAVAQIDRLVRDLEFNPNEVLALQALLVRLGRLSA